MTGKLKNIINNTEFYNGSTLLQQLEKYHVPALSFTIINNNHIDCAYAIGTKKYGENNPITQDTLFQTGSVSKQIFATVVMKMFEDGLVDIDTDVHEYLKDFIVEDKGGKPGRITLRQLLSHTGGISVSGFDGYKKTWKYQICYPY